MVNVLEHVQNGIRILRNLFNALKPGEFNQDYD
jgi:2-polyprenyl-3-methyl-5-hydroxy-6-metoxy-1,4-benzoquinol methylase